MSLLRRLFFLLLVRPFVRFVVGLEVEGSENLPAEDPFLLVANHNSHLDTPLLLSLFPLARLAKIRPVAAADYWQSTGLKRFVGEQLFNTLPIERGAQGARGDPLAPLHDALRRGESLLVFPEGTRGEPEVMGKFRSGAARLAAAHPEIPVVPVHLKNAGRTLPRGDALFVPFVCRVAIGKPLAPSADHHELLRALEEAVRSLSGETSQEASGGAEGS